MVTPEIEKLPDGDVTVAFKIAEGRKITIDRVVIEGAHGVPAKEIKAAMATQERDYYVLPGTVQRQKLDEDVERIVALYNDYGYIQARVESSDVQIDRANAKAVIRIVVVEGPQFKVGGVDVTGTAVLPVEEIKRRIKLAPGDVFSRSKLRDSTKAITDLYSAIGRASADAIPEIVQDNPNRKVNITFEIIEGPEVFVERINITRQYPEPGEDPPAGGPHGRGRSLHEPEARAGAAAAGEPELLRDGQRHDGPRPPPRTRSS